MEMNKCEHIECPYRACVFHDCHDEDEQYPKPLFSFPEDEYEQSYCMKYLDI